MNLLDVWLLQLLVLPRHPVGDAGLALPVGRGGGGGEADLDGLEQKPGRIFDLAQVSFKKLLTLGFKIMWRRLSAF